MKIKFITINIWQGGNLLDKAIDFLQYENPDVLLMQEVYNGKDHSFDKKYRTFDFIKESLGFAHAAFSPAFLDTRSIGNIDRGNAVFSKFTIFTNLTISYNVPYGPYDEAQNINYEEIPMCLEHAVLSLQNNTVNVYNLHGIWGRNAKDNEKRLSMSRTIVENIKGRKRVILAGDFNVNPHTKTIQHIEKYLRSVFKDELQTTFNMKYKEKPELLESVVDMIFVSDNIRIIDHYCPQVDISDHLPLVCVLEI